MASSSIPRGARRAARAVTGVTLLALGLGALTGGPAGAQDPLDPTAPPQVSHFVFTPLVLTPGHKGAFRFLTSREGAGDIVLERLTPGHRTRVGRLRFAVDGGDAKKAFDGRVGGKRLKAGRYRATLHVINADVGSSAAARLTLRVK